MILKWEWLDVVVHERCPSSGERAETIVELHRRARSGR